MKTGKMVLWPTIPFSITAAVPVVIETVENLESFSLVTNGPFLSYETYYDMLGCAINAGSFYLPKQSISVHSCSQFQPRNSIFRAPNIFSPSGLGNETVCGQSLLRNNANR